MPTIRKLPKGRVDIGEITTGPSEQEYEQSAWDRRLRQAEQNLQEQGIANGPDVTWTQRDEAPEQDGFDEQEFLSGLRTIGRQILQGATFDFGDELAGGVVSALPESARGYLAETFAPDDATPEERERYRQAGRDVTYREVQQAGQAQSERDREERPLVSLASNVAGGLMASRVAGPGLNQGARAAGSAVERAAPALTRPLRTAASAIRGSTAGRVGSNIVGGTALGAGYGALAGAGASQGNLDTEEGRARMAEDAGSGATAGAVFGGGLSALGEGLNAAVPYVRRNISRLQGAQADIPPEMMDELMAPPSGAEPRTVMETIQRTASPQTVERRLGQMGQEAGERLLSAEGNATVSSLIMDDVQQLAQDAIDRIPTGIQPRLKRVLRNLNAEANRWNRWSADGMPVQSMNAILDELAMLGQQGSKEAARIHRDLTALTRQGVQSSGTEARAFANVMSAVDEQAASQGGMPFSSPNITRMRQQAQETIATVATLEQQQRIMGNVDKALTQLKRNIQEHGGSVSPLSLQDMIGRYATWTISSVPLSPRDAQRLLPAVAGLLRVGIQGVMNPAMAGIPRSTVQITPRSTSQREPSPSVEEPMEEPVEDNQLELEQVEAEMERRRELQEIEAEMERRRELQEIEQELERRRNQGRSLRSQRRRQRRQANMSNGQ